MEDYSSDEIFENILVKKVIEYKWSFIKKFAKKLLILKCAFVLCIGLHSLKPGRKEWLYTLISFASVFSLCELIVWKDSHYSLKYVDKLEILNIILVFVYCI